MPGIRAKFADQFYSREQRLMTDYFRGFALAGLISTTDPREMARLLSAGLIYIRLEHYVMGAQPSPHAKVIEAVDHFLAFFLSLLGAKDAEPTQSRTRQPQDKRKARKRGARLMPRQRGVARRADDVRKTCQTRFAMSASQARNPQARRRAAGAFRAARFWSSAAGQRTFDAATDPVGNGRAMSLLFAREGAHVAVADMNRASAEDTVQRIVAEGGQAFSIEANIAREDDVNRMIDEAMDGLGGIDGMVLNVGIGVGALGLDGVDLKEWNDTFAVNLTGPMLCCRKALKHSPTGPRSCSSRRSRPFVPARS